MTRSPNHPPQFAAVDATQTAAHVMTGPEAAAQDRVRMLEHLSDNTGRPILYLDAGHNIRFVNKPFQAWISRSDAEIVGKHATEVFSAEAYAFYRPYLERAAVVVVPIRMGGGTRLKVVESLALARPMVSTTRSCAAGSISRNEKTERVGSRRSKMARA